VIYFKKVNFINIISKTRPRLISNYILIQSSFKTKDTNVIRLKKISYI
jgi:hypothetical protein